MKQKEVQLQTTAEACLRWEKLGITDKMFSDRLEQ